MRNFFHSFHIVTIRPWPILCGIARLLIITSFILIFKTSLLFSGGVSLIILFLFSFLWWRDVTREGCFIGDHSNKVQDGLKWGIGLFIFREVLFFIAWFWAFFHHRTVPSHDIGILWPPIAVIPFNPFRIPLLNTAILLSSGVFVTWAHHNVLYSKNIFLPLFMTVLLGGIFTFFQIFEYKSRTFSIRDRAYGTTFFVSTGFHGVHVIVGSLFLLVCLIRTTKNHFVYNHHIGLEFSIWYWHFVDVVWLFLFSFIYWWGWV